MFVFSIKLSCTLVLCTYACLPSLTLQWSHVSAFCFSCITSNYPLPSFLLLFTKTRPIILNLPQQALLTANYGDRTQIHRKLLPDRSDKLLNVYKWKKARFLYKTGSLLRRWHEDVLWCCFERMMYVYSDHCCFCESSHCVIDEGSCRFKSK